MSKKHFIALADMIRHANTNNSSNGDFPFTPSAVLLLANFCSQQNANFKRDRWLDYIAGKCGPNGGKIS